MGLINNLFSILFFMIPEDPWPVFTDWFAAYLNDIAIRAMKALATVFWFLEKIAAGITDYFLNESMWDIIINVVFNQLKATLPQILKDVIAPGQTGAAAGLLYLALFLAGFLMVMPGIDHKRLVDPGRVLLWAFVIAIFFISNTTGYDIVGAIEKLRGDTTQIIIGSNNRNLNDLVSLPMIASDTDLENYSFVLSDPFVNKYFPDATDFDTRTALIIDSALLRWEMEVKVETEASQKDRREKGQIGLAVSGLTIIGAIVLIMIATILATLTASALILIMFFLICLPLGFFEFGSAILSGITRQYVYVWAITLLSAILPRILIAANSLAYQNGAGNLTQIMSTVPILIIVAIATSYISAMAGKAMLDTFSVISTSISTAMAPLNYAGQMPQGGMLGGGPLQGGANLAGAAALAAVTGGAALATAGGTVLGTAASAGVTGGGRAALMAGAGAMAGQISKKGGEVAGGVAMGMMGEKASVFASAARGRGVAAVAQIAGTRYRRQKSKEEKEEQDYLNQELKDEQVRKAKSRKFSSQAKAPQDDLPDQYKADSVNAGSYLTHDPGHLTKAEEAFKQKKHTTARHHLRAAFGSQEIANQAMNQYERHGNLGIRKVRHIAQAARVTAQGMATRGQVIFAGGNLNEGFSRRALGLLDQSDSFDPDNQEDLALAAQISGATVRQPSNMWRDPFAAASLGSHVYQSPEDPHPYCQDPSAAFALHDMAKGRGWGEQELSATFEATKEAQALGKLGEQPNVDQVVQRMNQHGELVGNPERDNREAARLALLVLGNNQNPVSVPVPVPMPAQQNGPPPYSDQGPPPPYFDQGPPPPYSDQGPPLPYSDQGPPPPYFDQGPPPPYFDQGPPPPYFDQGPPPPYYDQGSPPPQAPQAQVPQAQAPQAQAQASPAQVPQTQASQVQVPPAQAQASQAQVSPAQVPQAQAAQVQVAQAQAPQVQVPPAQAQASQAQVSPAQVPQAQAAQVQVPQAQAAQVQVPQAQAAQVQVPPAQASQAQASQVQVSQVQAAQVQKALQVQASQVQALQVQQASQASFIPDQAASPFVPDQAASPFVPDQTASPFVPDQTASPFVPDQTASPLELDQTASPLELDQTASPLELDQTASPLMPDQASQTQAMDQTALPLVPDQVSQTQAMDQTASPLELDQAASPLELDQAASPLGLDQAAS